MTRRQLYALLPPRRTPIAYPSRVLSLPVMRDAVFDLPHSEEYELDRELSVTVQYRLANPREYPSFRIPIPKGKTAINDNLIDVLLFGSWSNPVKSIQNPDDEILSRPVILGPEYRRVR